MATSFLVREEEIEGVARRRNELYSHSLVLIDVCRVWKLNSGPTGRLMCCQSRVFAN
jgi:hypothetical protein